MEAVTIKTPDLKETLTTHYGVTDNVVEKLLLRVFQQDDHAAFEKLFHLLYKPLCRYCRKFVTSMEISEEVVGDVFFALWKNRKKYHITSSALSYLFMATRNRAYDHLRKIQRDRSCELDLAIEISSPEPSSLQLLEGLELQESLRTAIDGLPPSCRKIFIMSRDFGLKYHEIASQLNVSVKTVETQMGRALKHIRLHYESSRLNL